MVAEVFTEVSLIMILVLAVATIARILKQPLIISYIITGIVVSFLHLIDHSETLTTLARIGVALLLFIVGLNLNPRMIRDVGVVIVVAGIGQVLLTGAAAFGLSLLLGFSNSASLFLAVALTFSSTIIVMKILTDKGENESLYGRITMGILIMQDLIAIFALMFLSGSGESMLTMGLFNLAKCFALVIVLGAIALYIFPRIGGAIAKSQEYLFLFSIGWCLALASLFAYFGLSVEIGALLAGVTLALTPYHYEISSKLKYLRDFFIILFFILLGSQIVASDIVQNLWLIIILSLFVIIGKPLAVMAIMGIMGYTKRNSFLTGLAIAQISEFSFIIIGLGAATGAIPSSTISLITIIGIISITASTYLIFNSRAIYGILSPYLSIFQRKGQKKDEHRYHNDVSYDIIIFGHNRIGSSLVESVTKLKKEYLVIDYEPRTVMELARRGIASQYGDASDDELLNELDFEHVRMVVSTIPDFETNLLLISKIRQRNKRSIIIVVSHQIEEAMQLYDVGASYVIMPHFLGAHHTCILLENYGLDTRRFLKEKLKHIQHLHERKNAHHEHPKAEKLTR